MRYFYTEQGFVVNGKLPQNSIQLKQALPCFQIDLCMFFFDLDKLGKISRHHWKEGLKIINIAKFERDLLKTKRRSISKSERHLRKTLQMLERVRVQSCPPAPTIQTSVTFCNFAELYHRSLKTYHFQFWHFYYF